MATPAAPLDDRAMDKSPGHARHRFDRMRRWAEGFGSRRGQRALVTLAIGMALVLLLSYVKVLKDQVARAGTVQQVAQAGAARPAEAGVDGARADGARTSLDHIR